MSSSIILSFKEGSSGCLLFVISLRKFAPSANSRSLNSTASLAFIICSTLSGLLGIKEPSFYLKNRPRLQRGP